ncbi:TonB-dependent receptor [Shewanella mangrovi]|nr:carboxypeptidase regulatory-like domain-containing protein [Shewanella mangrovi]
MMIQGFTKSRLALALTLAIGASSMAYAADTTSSMRGTISGPDGQPAPNTKITLIHQPSGTVTEVTTNETGAFSASGLRVGGPYQIIIDSDKYQDTVESDIFLQLGQTFRLNEQLQPAGEVERITVTGSQIAYSSNAGSASTFGSDAIQKAPSLNRDLKDILRQNPLATALGGDNNEFTVAGANPRFNSINVDGVGLNDDFGLNGNGYPTQRSPVSLDAVEQISIDANPYDAKYGGFSGARINAVTKSGTNEFHGGAFYEKTSDSWAGEYDSYSSSADKMVSTEVQGVKSDTYGVHLGGPLIKDKLFFFANYEKWEKPTAAEYGPAGAGASRDAGYTQEQLDRVRAAARDRYGIEDIGGWQGNPKEEDEKILVKLDWNINDIHRASFTYNSDESNSIRGPSDSSYNLNLTSNWYNYQQKMDAYSFQLYSDWTSDFSTELAVAYKDVKSVSGIATRAYGEVNVDNDNSVNDAGYDVQGDGLVFGPDEYRHANFLETKTWAVNLNAEYLLGDHKLGFGAGYERLDIFNVYVNPSLGKWTFDSIEDFEAGIGEIQYSNAPSNNTDDGAAAFVMGTYSAYVQDSWALTDAIDLTYGVRYERTFANDTPELNPLFVERYGFSNQENLDGKDIWLPRVGLTWYATDALTVRAGAGRFSGGKPNVWIANSFSKQGQNFDSVSGSFTDLTSLQVPQSILDEMSSKNPDGETDAIDPNFEIPSEWRYSIGYDYVFDIPVLGDQWTWSSQYIYTQKEDSLAWRDLNRQPSGTVTPDGRIVYEPVDASSPDHYDILLTNADRDGHSSIITTSLNKSWESGVNLTMSYAYQDITDGNTGTSSQAASNYKYDVVANRNVDYIGTGNYEIEHSFKINLGYTHQFFAGYDTSVNVMFERRSGKPFGWILGTYRGDSLGDQDYLSRYNAYTPYIPTGPDDPNVAYSGGMDYESFMEDYVRPAGLEKYAGGYVPKNASKKPWVTTLDLSVQQEIPGFMEGHKGMLYFTVQNLANLLNKDWGHVYDVSGGFNKEFANATWRDGTLTYSPNSRVDLGPEASSDPFYELDSDQSVWYLKVGVKYTF